MFTSKRKMRIVVATILSIFVGLIYLNLVGILFPNIPNVISFNNSYKYKEIILPETSNLESVKIAFFGDQSIEDSSKKVLELIKENNVDLIVLLGDFDYKDNPKKFRELYESVYSDSYPLLAVVGNHDVLKWKEYKEWMSEIEIDNLNCEGEYGEASVCNFGPVSIISSAIGTLPGEHETFLKNILPRVENSWKICAWHKNHHGYQIGGKNTEVPLDMYQLCADNNALVMTGHEHSYSRSYGIGDVTNFEVNDKVSPFDIKKSSIITVSGLGGHSVRDIHSDVKDIWASTYSEENNNAVAGALICEFAKTLADCEFINIRGEIIDQFKVTN